jgi:hypothetical protein
MQPAPFAGAAREGYMKKYPTLRLALQMLCNDQGLEADAVILESVDFEHVSLAKAEAALASLSKEDLETLCVGDQEECGKIHNRLLKDGYDPDQAHQALECMFYSTGVLGKPE